MVGLFGSNRIQKSRTVIVNYEKVYQNPVNVK